MKKLVSLLLVVMMVLTMAPALADDRIEIIVGTNSLNNGHPEDPADNFIEQKILADTGVQWTMTKVDDYWTAMAQRIIGDNLPDVFYMTPEYLKTYAIDEEVVLDLTPYMDNELKAVFDWLGNTVLTPYTLGGKLYGIPKYYDSQSQWGINIREDWLKALNLEVPETLQDLYDVAKAFVEQDPDGNGVADTLGVSGAKGLPVFQMMAGAYDTAFGNYIILRDGKVTNTLLQPGVKDALIWAKKFVDDGLVDPDVASTAGTNKMIAGQVGIMMVTWPGLWKQYGQDNMKAVNPNADLCVAGPLASEVGAEPALYPVAAVGGSSFYVLNANLADQPEKLEAVLKVLNYLVSDEGYYSTMYGLEGIHWVVDEATGLRKMTDRASEANYLAAYQMYNRVEMEYLMTKFPEAKEAFDHSLNMKNIAYYNSMVQPPEEMYLAEMEGYINNQLTAFIYGERPIDEYDAFLDELRDLYMFDEYMEAATEQLNSYGYGV